MSNTCSWPYIDDSDFTSYTPPKQYSTRSAKSHTRGHGRHISASANGSARLSHSRSFSEIFFNSIFGTTQPREDCCGELSLPKTIYESSSDEVLREKSSSERPAVDTGLVTVAAESSPPLVIKDLVTDTVMQPSLRRRSWRHKTYSYARSGISPRTQNGAYSSCSTLEF